ncbi:uncharacterized protein LOC110981788 isoform X2 [Acanthaster planci]|uniref:Uncharacterized protein LOC110981788 isoform X2 n=1 Tax=Acanthaster planci TaxID=133434 RepID=A0A8B7YRR2_ACAPL|nr:uncharacterized protein LOC110981788 isoform X2 [Acanthaster planci]
MLWPPSFFTEYQSVTQSFTPYEFVAGYSPHVEQLFIEMSICQRSASEAIKSPEASKAQLCPLTPPMADKCLSHQDKENDGQLSQRKEKKRKDIWNLTVDLCGSAKKPCHPAVQGVTECATSHNLRSPEIKHNMTEHVLQHRGDFNINPLQRVPKTLKGPVFKHGHTMLMKKSTHITKKSETLTKNILLTDDFRKKYLKRYTDTEFSSLFISANDLNKNFFKINDYLLQLAYRWTVIGLSETFLKNCDPPVHLCDYTFIGDNRETKPGGGVGLYVHNHIHFKERRDLTVQVEKSETPCNSIFIEITEMNIIIGVIYKPPSVNCYKFVESLDKTLTQINQDNKVSFIMGDFNINLSEEKTIQQMFKETLRKHDHTTLIERPTRITETSKTLIDNIITNVAHAKVPVDTTSGVLVSDVSDHLPIFQVSTFDVSSDHDEKLKLDTQICENEPQKTDLSNASAHKKQIMEENDLPFRKDLWNTNKIKKKNKEKEELYLNYLKSSNQEDKEKYVQSRNNLERWISKTKSDIYINELCHYDKVWTITNQMQKTFKSGKPCACTSEDVIPREIISVSNSPYQSTNQPDHRTKGDSVETLRDGLLFTYTTFKEIEKLVDRIIKDNAHFGLHEICPQQAREVMTDINVSQRLSKIINQFLREGIAPNYSISSSLDIVSKQGKAMEECIPSGCSDEILERIVCNKIKNFFDKGIVNHNNPYLFETEKVKKMAYLLNEVRKGLRNKISPVGVFFYLKQSGLNQQILSNKLKKCGMSGTLLNLIVSYFKSKYQNTQSTITHNSCLLDLLYAIVMTDISNFPVIVNKNEIVVIFVDEKKWKKSTRQKKQKEARENLYNQLEENGLSIDRCCYIRFKNEENNVKPVKDQTAPKVTNEKIKRVDKTTFCGRSIDSGLIFHIGDEMHVCEEQKVIDECRKQDLLPPEVLTAAQLCSMKSQNVESD